jgi:hypothetical protein
MKKLLLTGACLAALSGPAFAACSNSVQFNALANQSRMNSNALDAMADKCSSAYFNLLERQTALARQGIALGCSGGRSPQQALQASVELYNTKKKECATEAAKKQQDHNTKEVPTPRRDNNAKIIPSKPDSSGRASPGSPTNPPVAKSPPTPQVPGEVTHMRWDGSPGDCARANALEKTTSAYEHACKRPSTELRDKLRAELSGKLDPRFRIIPPPESARVPTSPCGNGYGLKPDKNGFGRWTCQAFGGGIPRLTPDQEEAEEHLIAASNAIYASRIAKDNDTIALLKYIEDNFRKAAAQYAAQGDEDNRDAAYQEAGRIAVVRFLEKYSSGQPPLRECAMTIELFPSLNKANPQSADLVHRVSNVCESAIRQGH